jgi:hypothetical protein
MSISMADSQPFSVMRFVQKSPRGTGFQLAVLRDLGFQLIQRRRGILEAGGDSGGLPQKDRVPEANIQLGSDAGQTMGEEPVGHGSVEHGGGNASVRPPHVTFGRPIQFKIGYDRIVRPSQKPQAEPARILRTADDTMRMQPGAQVCVRPTPYIINDSIGKAIHSVLPEPSISMIILPRCRAWPMDVHHR